MKSIKVFTIAEIGQAHEGSLGILHSYIDALATTGVDAIKFQTHIAEAESSIYEPFRVNFSYEDKTRFDYWKRMSFSLKQWQGIKEHCDESGLEFLSSPFSLAAVDLLEEVGVKKYKIGSGEVNNFLMLDKIAETGKPIILSSGMSSLSELDKTIDFLKSYKSPLSVLQCTTRYPTTPKDIGLNVIQELKNRYNISVGLSDHSGTIWPSLGAVALGAEILEFHVVFDKKMFGPDSSSSLTIRQIERLVEGVRFLKECLSSPIDKSDNAQFSGLKNIFEKSLAVNKDLPSGHIITRGDLETKKPAGYGISASEFEVVLGKTLKTPLKKFDFLVESNLR